MIKRFKVLWILSASLLFLLAINTNTAFATTIAVKDNAVVHLKISSTDLTRLAVRGERMIAVRGTAGAYTIDNDNTQGAVFIKPTTPSKPFYLFISTEKGHNYLLQLTPALVSADIVVLKPTDTASHGSKIQKANKFSVMQLLQRMIAKAVPDDYMAIEPSAADSLPKMISPQLSVQLQTVYQGKQLIGAVFIVRNVTYRQLQLNPAQFYHPGDRAIALQTQILPAQGSLLLYKVTDVADHRSTKFEDLSEAEEDSQ